ncbi:MAG: toll/interleukin-1 receptor domain-containing protein [Chitinophagaceae bacterium]|nr:toll/interleukin-1 receptor domain-containing protein [Chitinophagaceae bacterium]
MSIAFISHSSKNKPLVEELFKKLGANNCVVDKYTFETGAKTIEEIFGNLQRTDLFVLIISSAALESNWVKKEVKFSKLLLGQQQIKRILPINIDKNVNYDDPRIPSWIRQNYNLKFVANLNIIASKIKRQLREIIIEDNPKIAERIQNFVGRNSQIEEFEDNYINIENLKPSTIVVSGLEGVGRRSFLKKAFEKNKVFNQSYEPIPINLEINDGIDDLILKLDEGFYSYKKDFITSLLKKEISEKIDFLKELLLEYLNNNDFIFFIDNGCLILRKGELNDWFVALANSAEFHNRIVFCIISRYRPSITELLKLKNKYIVQNIGPLSDSDKEKLFVKILNHRNISFEMQKLTKVLAFMNGFPEQLFYTADLIQDNGIDQVLKMENYITDYYDNKIFNQFRNILQNPKYKDILVVISQFGTISSEYLIDIFFDNEEFDSTLEVLYTLGAYELVGSGKEFLKINYALADYISRNTIAVSPAINSRIRYKIDTIVNDTSDIPTYSDTLNTLKQGLIKGIKIPDHLLLPSLVLKSISALYDNKEFKSVISLANRVIENTGYIDRQIQREIHYFLCLSYARLQDSRFETEIRYFSFPESEFLYGLYFRMKRNYAKAKVHLTNAVRNMPYKTQARSELVLALLALHEYSEAESLASENYKLHKNNPFYIQAYFKCLINRPADGNYDVELLNDLANRMAHNPHPRAKDMKLVMEAVLDYYVNGHHDQAKLKLRQSINFGQNKVNAFAELSKILKEENDLAAIAELNKQYDNAKDINEDE